MAPPPPLPTPPPKPIAEWRDTHSRWVYGLKIGLPLVALAILSSLFLFSRAITIDGALPFAEVDIEDRLREPKMTDARIATTAENGATIDILADAVVPQGLEDAAARNAAGTITAPSGSVTTISAPLIEYRGAAQTAALTGGVKVASSGYQMVTDALDVSILDAKLASRGAVQAKGPLGTLHAGRMLLRQNDGGFVLVFNSGVKLVYTP